MSNLLGKDKIEVFCMTDADCDLRVPAEIGATTCEFFGNPTSNTFSFDDILLSILNIF